MTITKHNILYQIKLKSINLSSKNGQFFNLFPRYETLLVSNPLVSCSILLINFFCFIDFQNYRIIFNFRNFLLIKYSNYTDCSVKTVKRDEIRYNTMWHGCHLIYFWLVPLVNASGYVCCNKQWMHCR